MGPPVLSRCDRRTVLRAGVAVAVSVMAACTTKPARAGATVEKLIVELSSGRSLTVHVRVGAQPSSTTPVLMVLHGTERNPTSYLAAWEPLIEGSDIVVLAPEFTDRDFPGSDSYNLGGLREDGKDRSPEDRTFAALEAVLAAAKEWFGLDAEHFDLFGHSAGAQFVHRYLTFTPDAPVRRAIAANAGWYTMPDPAVPYPYGLKDAPEPRAQLRDLLAADLRILLGGEDTTEENLRQDAGANKQGATRIERGLAYYQRGKQIAESKQLDFRWTLEEVSGVAHDQAGMAKAAAVYLLPGA